jgi:carbonic anhydrase
MLKPVRISTAILLATLIAGAASAQPPAPSQSATPSADPVWSALAAGNHRFASGTPESRNAVARRKQLTSTQHPRAVVLSCSDSRVPPEAVFDQGLGDLFVIRSAGQSADPLSVGSIEYAVEHLGAKEIVVMGHQHCGAVTAACSGEKPESANLLAVVAPITASCAKADRSKADPIDDPIKDHVHSVAMELLAKSALLTHAVAAHQLTIVEAYYSLDTGVVTRLR